MNFRLRISCRFLFSIWLQQKVRARTLSSLAYQCNFVELTKAKFDKVSYGAIAMLYKLWAWKQISYILLPKTRIIKMGKEDHLLLALD